MVAMQTFVFGARVSKKLGRALFVVTAGLWLAACSSNAATAPNEVPSNNPDGGGNNPSDGGNGVTDTGTITLSDGNVVNPDACVTADGGHCYAPVDSGPYCGDGIVQTDLGEVCDDGNRLSGDGCAPNCKLVEPYFTCPSQGGKCTSTIACGNSKREPGEECDDGNTNSNDGCTSACKLEPNYRCPTPGQPCQSTGSCGDGKTVSPETCDLGSANGTGQGCESNCKVTPGWTCKGHTCKQVAVCGDGKVQSGEECDEGTASTGCCINCKVAANYCTCPSSGGACTDSSRCGNGKLEKTETCDDGNTNSNDGCSSSCQVETGYQCRMPNAACIPLCGDGIITGTETCDDRQADPANGDGCSATCQTEPGWTCTGTPSTCTKAQCGNGVKEVGESCDKGAPPTVANGTNGLFYGDGSGCSKTCTQEPLCRPAGGGPTGACQQMCGDGNIDTNAGEECDDGNQVSGDGCSSACKKESGFTCNPQTNADTQACPSASGLQCLVLPVIFRDFDGHQVSGGHPDFFFYGASATSPVAHSTGVSPGATTTTCVPNATGTKAPWPGTTDAYACPSTDQTGPCTGIAQSVLGNNGKPTLGTQSCPCVFTDWDQTGILGTAGGANCVAAAGLSAVNDCWVKGNGSHRCRIDTTVKVVESATTFAQWYTDSIYSNKVLGTLELASIGSGMYQFSSSTPGAPAGTAGSTVADDIHKICLLAAAPRTGSLTSGFFPLENYTGKKGTVCNIWPYWLPQLATAANCVANSGSVVKSQWDVAASYDNCPTTGTGGPVPSSGGTNGSVNGVMRNFYTTTEARYLFRWDGVGGTLGFYGDDDVWVFVNGKLAIDLGAPHERITQSITLSAANAGTYGLTTGNTYEIAVFHADRHPRESNYQLTLTGFSTTRSVCQPTCGDNTATAGEECDKGSSNCTPSGSSDCYNQCLNTCKWGPFCGDGVTQASDGEECDDGRNTTVSASASSGCGPGCKLPPRCGDGILQAGEECDKGNSNADTQCGGCSTKCQLNAYCGDGTVDNGQNGTASCGEECDDGDNSGGYGFCGSSSQTLPNCLLGPRCGDGVTQTDQGEACDNGSANGDSRCTTTCQIPGYCGDGVVQADRGETCDNGKNDNSYGGCTPDCQRGPYCGDGVVQAAGNEQCDYGSGNSLPGAAVPYGGCTDQCKLGPHCGDGVVQSPDEQCDLGVGKNGPTTECSENCIKQQQVG
jgi:fibro-slime domain-containing protein